MLKSYTLIPTVYEQFDGKDGVRKMKVSGIVLDPEGLPSINTIYVNGSDKIDNFMRALQISKENKHPTEVACLKIELDILESGLSRQINYQSCLPCDVGIQLSVGD